jgi:hypothetical protein
MSAATRRSPRHQVVVLRDGDRRFFEDHLYVMSSQQCQCFRAGFELEFSPAAENDDCGLESEEFLHVCWLDTRLMVGSGFDPVPLPCAARPELGVAISAQSLDVELAPTVAQNPW